MVRTRRIIIFCVLSLASCNLLVSLRVMKQVLVPDDVIRHLNVNEIFDGVTPRAFEPRRLRCFPAEVGWENKTVQDTPLEKGFMFLKPLKCGSSTASGIHLRIAVNAGQRLNNTMCAARFDHGPYKGPGYRLFSQRDRENSFLWTILRDPSSRALSQFFHFDVGWSMTQPTDANIIKFMKGSNPIDYYLRTFHTRSDFKRKAMNGTNVANEILQDYDFIGITERMDETAVVLMMLLGLKISDVLYLSAKVNGGYDAMIRCTYIWPSFRSAGVRQYLASDDWQDRIRYDLALYNAANRSLDLTIDRLGRAAFERRLRLFRAARKEADSVCLPKAIFPCSEGGEYRNETDCIWKDSGCGKHCLDEVGVKFDAMQ